MEEYWVPKVPSLSAGVTSSNTPSEPAKAELPDIGQKLLLVIHPYGGVSIAQSAHLSGGLDVVEVEVRAIKKTKVSFE